MGKRMLLDAIQSAFGTATQAYRSAANTLATYVYRGPASDLLRIAPAYQHQALSAHSPFTQRCSSRDLTANIDQQERYGVG